MGKTKLNETHIFGIRIFSQFFYISIGVKIPFFKVLVIIEPGRSLQFVATNWIKQFVVTNCSKERPCSIVNETLKNGISMLKDKSKESDFYADFKYISFIKFSLRHQKLRARENLPYFGKQGETPPKSHHRTLTKITPSHSAYERTLLQKFQAPIYKDRLRVRVYLLFFPGFIVSTNWSQNIARELTEMKSSSALFK